MKAYVVGYAPEKKEKPENEEDLYKPTVTLVQYSKGQEWTMEERESADWACRYLEGLRVCVGEHSCAFTVEELPGRWVRHRVFIPHGADLQDGIAGRMGHSKLRTK